MGQSWHSNTSSQVRVVEMTEWYQLHIQFLLLCVFPCISPKSSRIINILIVTTSTIWKKYQLLRYDTGSCQLTPHWIKNCEMTPAIPWRALSYKLRYDMEWCQLHTQSYKYYCYSKLCKKLYKCFIFPPFWFNLKEKKGSLLFFPSQQVTPTSWLCKMTLTNNIHYFLWDQTLNSNTVILQIP